MSPVTLITGAGRGIGRATAIELAKRNHRLALAARTLHELQSTCDQIGGGLPIVADVTHADEIDELIHRVLDSHGRIDNLVNTVGLAPQVSAADMQIDHWHAVIETNLSAAFYLAKALWPIFLKQQGGIIVNISSLASRDPFSGFAAYGAAKAGLNIFDLVLAREGAPHNIRVHTIAPGAVETDMFRALIPEEKYPRSKTLDPADVAAVVAQCVCGDLQYTSGEVIYLSKTRD